MTIHDTKPRSNNAEGRKEGRKEERKDGRKKESGRLIQIWPLMREGKKI